MRSNALLTLLFLVTISLPLAANLAGIDGADPGAENRELMQGWLATWSQSAMAAARQLQPIWSQISEKVVRFEDSLERSRERQESLAGDIGLETPKEVKS